MGRDPDGVLTGRIASKDRGEVDTGGRGQGLCPAGVDGHAVADERYQREAEADLAQREDHLDTRSRLGNSPIDPSAVGGQDSPINNNIGIQVGAKDIAASWPPVLNSVANRTRKTVPAVAVRLELYLVLADGG